MNLRSATLFFLFVLIGCPSVFAQSPLGSSKKTPPQPPPLPYFDLDFERVGTMHPWQFTLGAFEYDLDSVTTSHGKQSLSMAWTGPESAFSEAEGAIVSQVVPCGLVGAQKWKLEITVDIMCKGITKGAANFYAAPLKADSGTLKMYRNLIADSIRGTMQWKTYHLSMDCDSNTKNLQLACMLSGTGKVWFDNITIKINGTLIPRADKPIVPEMTDEEKHTLAAKVVPFDLNGTVDDPNLKNLDSVIGDHKLLGLGEATNGTHEFFQAKTLP